MQIARLEIDGSTIPAGASEASRILIDGDRFRTESPEATYEGVFNINVEAQPHEIDIEFVEGPEAGNWNFGIFRLEGDQFELCLNVNGKPRPPAFRTSPGSGHAYETLKRTSHSRPENVTGGTASALEASRAEAALADATAAMPAILDQISSIENELCLLLGRAPGPIARTGQSLDAMMPPDVPAVPVTEVALPQPTANAAASASPSAGM